MNALAGESCTLCTGTVPFDVARRVASGLALPHGRVEEVSLTVARGRVLAQPIVAPGPLPPFDQAAMDGYAVRLAGRTGIPLILPVVGRTDAGDPPSRLVPGTAHRIMTGAALPQGADSVVMQEHVALKGDTARIDADLPANQHIRQAGEDVPRGAIVLARGQRLDWPEIGLLAGLGVAMVPVVAPAKIAIVRTGAELCEAGAGLTDGQIYDAAGPMLAALLSAGSVTVDSYRVDDGTAVLAAALNDVAASHDLVITTGGMASGLRDHVRDAVAAIGGRLMVGGVAMKPGKPLAFGRIGSACFVGLPGNPQASAFATLAFVRPMIDALIGAAPPALRFAMLAHSWNCARGRTELLPVTLGVEGRLLIAHASGPGGSHRMMPMVNADALAIVSEPAEAGAIVEILPFDRQRW
ncbi:MAG: molybdopterin molybdotransferase MoeA [Bauldia sp.]|nr:molybdopterin molybdotransferase MoeA [Bauldia sp.]